MRIDGATALVTGGASGLGKATVVRFHSLGANVVIVDLDASKGERLAGELGGRAAYARTDVSNDEQVQAAIALAMAKFGKVDILINCAAIGVMESTFSRSRGPHDLKSFKRVIDVCLIGTFDMTRLCAQQMANNTPNADEERGVIVNTASVAALEPIDGSVAYAAAKAAVIGMTATIANDLGRYGIRACTIVPGNFDTPFRSALPEQYRDAILDNLVFPRRIGRPPEYAMLVQQIVENPMLNGETIRLDGGARIGTRARRGS